MFAGIWSFTDWKVNNGDRIKACALNTETGSQACGYGTADKSRTDTIHISVSGIPQGKNDICNYLVSSGIDVKCRDLIKQPSAQPPQENWGGYVN